MSCAITAYHVRNPNALFHYVYGRLIQLSTASTMHYFWISSPFFSEANGYKTLPIRTLHSANSELLSKLSALQFQVAFGPCRTCPWHLNKSFEWATMMIGFNEKPKNVNQNMTMNRSYPAPFLTTSTPIENPEPQLSIYTNLVKNESM